jgi:6-phosphogluconate dehydrogenase (decarboxylating)
LAKWKHGAITEVLSGMVGLGRMGGNMSLRLTQGGPNSAGHFVKMVHNGIEYGLMQAFGARAST